MAEKEYIEREAAFDAVFGQFCASSDETEAALNAAIEEIRVIPAANVRPVRRGRWIPDYDYAEYDFDGSTPLSEPRKFQDGWQCSLCGAYEPSKTNFCHNCGADMREES